MTDLIPETYAAGASRDAIEIQDDDFLALGITLRFDVKNSGLEGHEDPCEDHLPTWEFVDDEAENAAILEGLIPEIIDGLAPLVAHFASLGLLRADNLFGFASSGRSDLTDGPAFYLVSPRNGLDPAALASFSPVEIRLKSLSGATVIISPCANELNATLLFDAARRCPPILGHWGGELTPDLFPLADESRDAWLARVAMPQEALARALERWEVSGRDPEVYRAYGDVSEREMGDCEISWLVEGRIPRREITLLAGDSAAGKSSMAHAWMAALGGSEVTSPRTILDREVSGRFVAALISGEDSDGTINFRAARHAKLWGPAKYLVFADMTKGVEHYLTKLWAMPVLDLVIVDPVRAFFVGNEKEPGDVDRFFAPFLALARAKNCAVILVHHITKGAVRDLGECRSLAELKVRIRGSGAFTQVPRMVIGAVRRRDGTVEVGPVKHNLPAEIVWLAMGQGKRYWPNPDTFTLDPIASEASPEVSTGTTGRSVDDRVLAAIERCNRTGSTVRKSGKTGLFESKLPELAGVPRATILDAISSLALRGELTDGEAGLLIVAAPAAEGAAA